MTDALAREITELWRSWQRELRYQGRSALTIRTYGQTMSQFAAHMAGTKAARLEGITREHVRAWLTAMQDAGLSPNTVHTRYRNVRTFALWLVREGELKRPFTDGLPGPSIVEQPVDVIPLDGVRAMLATCDGKTFRGRRDDAIIRVLADSGVRVSELCGLTVPDADMDQQVLWVHGKGGRIRAAPFSDRTATAIDRYLRMRRRYPKAASSDRLWLGHMGPIGAEGIRRMIHNRGLAAGIGHVHPHQLRHTAAHEQSLAGMSDRDLKRIFGWRSDKMVARYGASAADQRALQAFRRYSIGDRL